VLQGASPTAPQAYINANYVRFPSVPQQLSYIVCQGPLPNTIVDMWKMIWQEGMEVVVMLCDLGEEDRKGRIRCEQYFPTTVGASQTYGGVTVLLTACAEASGGTTTVRMLSVTCKGQTRAVRHIQQKGWDDKGPPNLGNFMELLRIVDNQRLSVTKVNVPMGVHCSGGCDRSGTFILCDIIKAKLRDGLVPDAIEILTTLRAQRAGQIHYDSQMSFCYDFALSLLMGRNVNAGVSASPLKQQLNLGKQGVESTDL
jgi:protein tyrosine phosphatase